jgi:hypothetical protein
VVARRRQAAASRNAEENTFSFLATKPRYTVRCGSGVPAQGGEGWRA